MLTFARPRLRAKGMGQAFGRRLRKARIAAGLSQGGLGGRIGLTRQSISYLELGEREPSWETVRLLARVLGVSLDEFDVNDLQLPEPPAPRKRGRPRKHD